MAAPAPVNPQQIELQDDTTVTVTEEDILKALNPFNVKLAGADAAQFIRRNNVPFRMKMRSVGDDPDRLWWITFHPVQKTIGYCGSIWTPEGKPRQSINIQQAYSAATVRKIRTFLIKAFSSLLKNPPQYVMDAKDSDGENLLVIDKDDDGNVKSIDWNFAR